MSGGHDGKVRQPRYDRGKVARGIRPRTVHMRGNTFSKGLEQTEPHLSDGCYRSLPNPKLRVSDGGNREEAGREGEICDVKSAVVFTDTRRWKEVAAGRGNGFGGGVRVW